jgi:hypothetical protein
MSTRRRPAKAAAAATTREDEEDNDGDVSGALRGSSAVPKSAAPDDVVPLPRHASSALLSPPTFSDVDDDEYLGDVWVE